MVYYIVDKELALELYKSHIKIRSTGEVIGPILWYLSIATIPVVIVTSGIIGYLLLRRIELPLANFRDIVETIEKGDFTRRMPSDIPEALPDVFNEMAERLEKTFESLHRNVESLRFDVETIDSLTKSDSLSSSDEIRNTLMKITNTRKEIEGEMSEFKV